MTTLTTLPTELIEEIFKTILIQRAHDETPEDFLSAISLARTCRTMRDIGIKILFLYDPRCKTMKDLDKPHCEPRSPLERPHPNRANMTPANFYSELQNLEMRCISRMMDSREHERIVTESYRSMFEEINEEGDEAVTLAEARLWERLCNISGGDLGCFPVVKKMIRFGDFGIGSAWECQFDGLAQPM